MRIEILPEPERRELRAVWEEGNTAETEEPTESRGVYKDGQSEVILESADGRRLRLYPQIHLARSSRITERHMMTEQAGHSGSVKEKVYTGDWHITLSGYLTEECGESLMTQTHILSELQESAESVKVLNGTLNDNLGILRAAIRKVELPMTSGYESQRYRIELTSDDTALYRDLIGDSYSLGEIIRAESELIQEN